MTEEYVPVKGYEGLYEISRNGNVYSLTKKVILRTHISRVGYMEVRLKKDKKVKHKRLHRLLAEAFIHNLENKPCIDHIDGNKLNNSLDNLRWCTYKENSNNSHCLKKISECTSRAWKNGRKMSDEAIRKRSEGHYKALNQYTRDGLFLKSWRSVKEAALCLGIQASTISSVCRGNTPCKTAGGFKFKYIAEDKKSHITVDSDEPMRFGSEPLAKIERITDINEIV